MKSRSRELERPSPSQSRMSLVPLARPKTCSESRSMWDAHMTEASGPHVVCDATRLLVDPSRFSRARCPKHRRGYLCQSPTYHRYAPGAFGLACAWPSFRLEDFPKDHLRDIMEAVQTFPDADLPQVPVAAGACLWLAVLAICRLGWWSRRQ